MHVEDIMDPILEKLTIHCSGIPDFTNIESDSRKIESGSLFVAIAGYEIDGHDFLGQALENGAVAAVTERIIPSISIPQWKVTDTRRALSRLAYHFYKKPFSGKPIIGITGTNGKTSVAYATTKFLNDAGINTGSIGTLGLHQTEHQTKPTELTTPESLQLQQMLRYLEGASMACCAMEVSSHALIQKRVADVAFSTAVFTNLSRDHLDFHGDMNSYFNAKSLLFSNLNSDAIAIINADDERFEKLSQITTANIISYSISNETANFCGNNIAATAKGLIGKLGTPKGTIHVQSPMIGTFNISNLLGAVAAAMYNGANIESLENSIRNFAGAPGRLERFETNRANFYIDYAHTPDGFRNVFKCIKKIRDNSDLDGKIIALFGCGGDRDREKRAMMGAIAEYYSDEIIITDDNPRYEDSDLIIAQIVAGLKQPKNAKIIRDRTEAIIKTVELSNTGDFVLLLGKGHEKYQDIAGEKIPYSEKETLRKALGE